MLKPIAKPEYTVAAIKPDSLLHRDEIIQRIQSNGFETIGRVEVKLTPELVLRMYVNHQGQGYFSDVMDNLVSGPTLFMILWDVDAIKNWRKLMGPADPEKAKEEAPDSIRATFGQSIIKNATFGADSKNEADHLLHLIWGENAVVTDDGRIENATPVSGASRPPSGGIPDAEAQEEEKGETETAPQTEANAEEEPEHQNTDPSTNTNSDEASRTYFSALLCLLYFPT